jgi:hypothetical protein
LFGSLNHRVEKILLQIELVTSMTKAVTVVGASFEAPTKARQEEQRFLKYERKLKSLSGLARRFRFI